MFGVVESAVTMRTEAVPCFVLDGEGKTGITLHTNGDGLRGLVNKRRMCVHNCRFKADPDEQVRVRLGFRGKNGTRALGVISCAFGTAMDVSSEEVNSDGKMDE
jgi:hypothetical protein